MRTQEEIKRQIEGLEAMKASLPEFNFFGENNHEPIDAVISVLNGWETYEDYEDAEYSIESAVYEAESWLNGDSDEDLFE